MSKRVFIIHGWDGYPEEGWRPWIQKELEASGFEVYIPAMPDTHKPRIQNWVPYLSEIVGKPDENTYFIGHSMGNQAIARYLETLPDNVSVGGTVFVAGFFKRLTGLEDDPEVQETDHHWLDAPIDLEKVRKHLPKSVAIFSDNDPWVPLDNQDDFKEKLGSKIVVEHAMKHFSGDDGVNKLPIALKSLLEITK
ncbi:MAG: alpha/beta hydrolase [Candidatus Curtissbacteria bacterium]